MDRKEEQNQERNRQKEIFAGKVAVVTGASRGIGRAIALELARKGAMVVINYNGSEERAQEVQKCIEEEGNEAAIMQCDVSDFQACEAFFKKVIEQFGRLDILVNNAGITKDGLLMKLSEDDFDSVVDTNLKGSFHCMRFAARQMIRQRSGRIINLSSVSGVMGNAGQTNYFCVKSRRDWADKSGSAGASGKKYYSECNCTWIYCNRYDRKTFRSRKRNGGDTDSDGAFRDSGRYCTCGSISCYRRSGIYYRAGTLCGRRNGNVENEGERHEKKSSCDRIRSSDSDRQ